LIGLIALAQEKQDLNAMFVNLGIVVALVLVAGVVMLMVRKRIFAAGLDDETGGSMFEDLRRMRDAGEISIEEYEYLRKCIVAKVSGHEPPPRPAGLVDSIGELRAKPGYDLAGDPIPPEILEAKRRREQEGDEG